MRSVILVVLMILSVGILKAQSTISGQVINSSTKEPIAFVNVGVKKLAKGTVSDIEGRFALEIEDKQDLVSFSAIGYESIAVPAAELLRSKSVELAEISYRIASVEVNASRFGSEEKLFGLRNKDRGPSIGFGNAQLGTEIGSVIKIEKPTYIKTANFVLNHAKGDSLLLRVNIYKWKDGLIGENVLTENVFIQQEQKKGTISIDMSPYNLVLDSDVLLTLEWLRNFDEIGNQGITFDMKKGKKEKGVYLKYFSNGVFKKLPYQKKYGLCFYFIGKEVE